MREKCVNEYYCSAANKQSHALDVWLVGWRRVEKGGVGFVYVGRREAAA